MKKQKIAIIGAGICGLYLAWKLSEKGHNIIIFEKKKETGNAVCSGLFSQRILEFIPESRKLIKNKINFVRLHFPKKTVTVRFSKSFFVISHFELDKLAANLAREAGAKIILNNNISSIPKRFDKIIGCDGANSFIRKSLNLPEPVYKLGILGFTENSSLLANRELFSDSFNNYVETWPCKNGFIWKIPRNNEMEYGIISKPKLANKLFKEFLNKNNLSLEKTKAKIIPHGFIIPKNPSITLCGDAAGLTKPWSGGGVIWGLTAAEILLKTFPDFLAYRKSLKRFFLPKIIFSKLATKTIFFLGFKAPWLLPKKTKMESDFLL